MGRGLLLLAVRKDWENLSPTAWLPPVSTSCCLREMWKRWKHWRPESGGNARPKYEFALPT